MTEKIIINEAVTKRWGAHIDGERRNLSEDMQVAIAQLHENTAKKLGITSKNLAQNLAESTSIESLDESTSIGDNSIPDQPADGTGLNPLIFGILNRAMPTMMGNHWLGLHALSGPTGMIMAAHVNQVSVPNDGSAKTSQEVWKDARPDVNHSGNGSGGAMTDANAETLGRDSEVDASVAGVTNVYQSNPWQEMSFSLSSLNVKTGTRALKAYLTNEIIDDMQNLYGINAMSKLQNILRGQLVSEVDYELFNYIQSQAKIGAQGTTVPGTFNFVTDADGRHDQEYIKSFARFLDKEANIVGQQTRFGRANVLITSPNVASALENTVAFDRDVTIPSTLNTKNFVGMSYVGNFMGKYKVFVDPYATVDFATLVFKGSTPEEAGGYYCPYVPFRFYRAIGENDLNPRLGVKTRYALIHNPYASGAAQDNPYFRTFFVTNLP